MDQNLTTIHRSIQSLDPRLQAYKQLNSGAALGTNHSELVVSLRRRKIFLSHIFIRNRSDNDPREQGKAPRSSSKPLGFPKQGSDAGTTDHP